MVEEAASANRQPRKTAGRQAAKPSLSISDTGREMPWKASSMDGTCRVAKGGAAVWGTGACDPAAFLDHRRPIDRPNRRGTAGGSRCGSGHGIEGPSESSATDGSDHDGSDHDGCDHDGCDTDGCDTDAPE